MKIKLLLIDATFKLDIDILQDELNKLQQDFYYLVIVADVPEKFKMIEI